MASSASISEDICMPTGVHAPGDDGFGLDVSNLNLFNYAWVITAICVIFATILTIRLIYMHLVYFHKPNQQKHIVRILLMVPIYAIDSWLSFRFYWLSVYFDLIRDCYEAIVIYEFYTLLVEYTGGYERTKNAFEKRAPFKLVIPLCCWEVYPRRGLLRWLSRLTLQYVLERPLMAFVAMLLQVGGKYCNGELTAFSAGYPYITGIGLISVTVAMYALVLFYVVALEELKSCNPVPKFLSIKFIIMMSFWQQVLVAGLVKINVIHNTANWTTDNIAAGVQNALICVEMLIVSIWHLSAFNYQEFAAQGPKNTHIWPSLIMSFNLIDVVGDIYHSFFSFTIQRKDDVGLIEGKEFEPKKLRPPSAPPKTIPPFSSVILV